MQISNLKYSISFKSNLYYKNKEMPDLAFYFDDIKNEGNKNTDIFVHSLESKKDWDGEYKNGISFELKNPFLGKKTFYVENIHKTNVNAESDSLIRNDIIYGYFTLGNTVNQFEDKVLKETLIEKIRDCVKNNGFGNLNKIISEEIYNKVLNEDKLKEFGFSKHRINDFKRIADELIDEIIVKGVSKISKND